ncbi:MAG: uracil phosphoribosyltransferase [Pseudonocardiales bacterium]|nr:uracil phosphoribosyltransferase [Pseudonocardia sp.]MDT7599402.1 uracil phosphoribosyltransferase [Pseudonocardiales bacterium]
MDLLAVDHPLVKTWLSTLRDRRTDDAAFRAALRELTGMLVYEACRDSELVSGSIDTPLTGTTGHRLAKPPLLVPVLRAGLGMAEAALELLPQARMGFVGAARDERTHRPVPYMASLPESLVGHPVFLLDPMLATGGTLVHAVELAMARGATSITAICVLAAPEGLETVAASGLPVRVVTAQVDECLNEDKFIVPGLGDAGDRQFGPF